MSNRLYLFNASRKLRREVISKALEPICQVKELDVREVEDCRDIIEPFVEAAFNPARGQAHGQKVLDSLHSTRVFGQELGDDGKLIIIDRDLYSDYATNWCFGGFCPVSNSLGYILLSTARISDETLGEHIVRHELGHMFGAPSEGRTNTVDILGLHCSNNLCTMQQQLSVPEALRYAHRIKSAGIFPFCEQCVEDMRRYRPPERV
ncbi:hypothetical protein D6817_02245 [Candidatus Pacearchaeota archaeon]|nr:MAG: hypothetical protein D6817_02245 [Candidatus Pacearchaeota archaeon]